MGRPTRVLVACSGLGRIERGFETFAQESFTALSAEPTLRTWLAKAAGPTRPSELRVPSLDRRGWGARALAPAMRDTSGLPQVRRYEVEARTFALGLLPALRRLRPDVLLFSDPHLGTTVARLRRLLPADLRLLFCNGAPLRPPFPRFDHVQHPSASSYAEALAAGGAPTRHTHLPLGFDLDARPGPDGPEAVSALRSRLALPGDVPILLSVGAVNAHHKRTDHLVAEVARLPEPRPHLVVLGHRLPGDAEPIERAAAEALGRHGATFRTVASDEVTDYYDAADAFALASLTEGFGRVYVEALARGLPCVAHDTPHTRELFGELAHLVDLEVPGAGTAAIERALADTDPIAAAARRAAAADRFSWAALLPDYVDLVERCAAAPPHTARRRARRHGRTPRQRLR